jgi:hypothetical protein
MHWSKKKICDQSIFRSRSSTETTSVISKDVYEIMITGAMASAVDFQFKEISGSMKYNTYVPIATLHIGSNLQQRTVFRTISRCSLGKGSNICVALSTAQVSAFAIST